jgi:hypothetical protein
VPVRLGPEVQALPRELVMHHRFVHLRFRLHNAALDLWDRLRGRCANAPLSMAEGGYHFWRCGLCRRHVGPCRSGYYFWGPGGSIYDPEGPWVAGVHRRPVHTRRQRRFMDRWHALADAKRAAAFAEESRVAAAPSSKKGRSE